MSTMKSPSSSIEETSENANQFQTPPSAIVAARSPNGDTERAVRKRIRLDPEAEPLLLCTNFRAKLSKLLRSDRTSGEVQTGKRNGEIVSKEILEKQQKTSLALKQEVQCLTETQLKLHHELLKARQENTELRDHTGVLETKVRELENELDATKLDSEHMKHDLEVERENAKGCMRLLQKHEAARCHSSEQQDELQSALRMLKLDADRMCEGDAKLYDYFENWKKNKAALQTEVEAVSSLNRQLQVDNDSLSSATINATFQMKVIKKQVELLTEKARTLTAENGHLREYNLKILDKLQEFMSDKVAELFLEEPCKD